MNPRILTYFLARANSTFESERARLLAEVQELSGSKRRLEDALKTLTESDRHKTHTIKTLHDRLKSDVDKAKKEADVEAIRLVSKFTFARPCKTPCSLGGSVQMQNCVQTGPYSQNSFRERKPHMYSTSVFFLFAASNAP